VSLTGARGEQSEIHLNLSFLGNGNALAAYLEDVLETMRLQFFDNLIIVKLPDLRCRPDLSCPRSKQIFSAEKKSGVLQLFQKFLRGKHIHEIVVPDCPDHPHTNQEIEDILADSDVRVLNWRRADISITMLRKVAPNIESLHLYSSGNQDVLDYWTSYFGLYRFEKVSSSPTVLQSKQSFHKVSFTHRNHSSISFQSL
jgi:hypothetical protein